MPGTTQEYVALAIYPELPGDWADDFHWSDGSEMTRQEFLDVIRLRTYHRQLNKPKQREAQRKAMALLRKYLSPAHKIELRRNGVFHYTTNSGATYRVDPRRGRTERVTRHGSRWFVAVRFCLHDDRDVPSDAMPPADLALTHLLLLLSDESEFLRIANATYARDQLWNREWLRRLREARISRETISRTAVST